MSADKELTAIAEKMNGIKSRFTKTEKMYSAPHEDEVAFEGLVTEAKALLGEALGPVSDFRFKLASVETSMATSFYGGPSYNDVCTAIAAIEGAVRHIQRRQASPSLSIQNSAARLTYVDSGRIAELQRVSNTLLDRRGWCSFVLN